MWYDIRMGKESDIMKKRRLISTILLCGILALTSCGSENAAKDAAPSIEGGASDGAYDYYGDYSAESDGFSAGSEDFSDAGSYEKADTEAAMDYYEPEIEPSKGEQTIAPHSGLLTGGEWNDNSNFDFWTDLVSQRTDWNGMAEKWDFHTTGRIAVKVKSGDAPAENVSLKLMSGTTVLWEAMTDNNGNAYLFRTISKNSQYMPTKIIAEQGGKPLGEFDYNGENSIELNVQAKQYGGDILDLMFVVDTTGSMGDELAYLQVELQDIIEQVASDKQIPVRLSLNFYRDESDEYVVNPFDFTPDIDDAIRFLSQQYATGGGDYEEAVEIALNHAINESTWQEGNTKLMFLVLDAPPHYNEANSQKLKELLAMAAKHGIRIIPVASSGIDTETEFLCRTFAISTGGTYTFLTDHSGIGNSHLEPTVGNYEVEKLNDMIVRIIESYL